MALRFDGTNDSLVLGDHSALTLTPPFTIACWMRIDDNTDYRQLFLWEDESTDDYLAVYLRKTGVTRENDMFFLFRDAGGDSVSAYTYFDCGTNRNWQHYAITCTSGGFARHWCDGVGKGGNTNASFGGVNASADFYIGSNNNTWWWDGRIAELAKWDVELSDTQIAALAAGVRPSEVGNRPAWYIPALSNPGEEIAELDATNNGSTVAEHPPRVVPASTPFVLQSRLSPIIGPYRTSVASASASGPAEGRIFHTGVSIGQVNEQ